MEIAPGIHRIETPLGDRFVCLYLLVGSEHALLLDTGVDSTPTEYLAPYLDEIGLPFADLIFWCKKHYAARRRLLEKRIKAMIDSHM